MKLKPKPAVIAVALFGFGVFAAVWAVIWLSRNSYLTAAVMLGLALWAFGFAYYFIYATSGRSTPRRSVGSGAILLRPPSSLDTVFVVATAATTVTATLFLVFNTLDMLDYVPTGVERSMAYTGSVFLLLFGIPTLFRMIKHGGGGHLRLSPAGFEVWNGQWGTYKQGPWSDVEDILDHQPKRKKSFHDVIVFILPEGRSVMLVADAIMGDSNSLRRWVRFYWQHPEHRDELADSRGLRRLDEQDFSVD